MIETKLLEKFSEDEIKHFYINFELNFKDYEKRNKGVVETLFGFIDFSKFIETALTWQKTNIISRCLIIFLKFKLNEIIFRKRFFLFFLIKKEDLNDSRIGWQKSTEFNEESKYKVICYRRPLENSDLLVIRTQGDFKNVTLE